jgi:hypothetical protein
MGELIKFTGEYHYEEPAKTELRKVIDGELTAEEYVRNVRQRVRERYGLPAEAGNKRLHERVQEARRQAASRSLASKALGLLTKNKNT